MQLKLRRRTGTAGKHALEVRERLEQRIGMRALGRRLLPAKPGPQPVQATSQLSIQLIEALQGKGQPRFFRCRFEREPSQQFDEPGPQPAGPPSVTGQNLSQEDAEAAAATATLTAVATPYPLAAKTRAFGRERIVAVELAVAV
jgi:hypothetical protein